MSLDLLSAALEASGVVVVGSLEPDSTLARSAERWSYEGRSLRVLYSSERGYGFEYVQEGVGGHRVEYYVEHIGTALAAVRGHLDPDWSRSAVSLAAVVGLLNHELSTLLLDPSSGSWRIGRVTLTALSEPTLKFHVAVEGTPDEEDTVEIWEVLNMHNAVALVGMVKEVNHHPGLPQSLPFLNGYELTMGRGSLPYYVDLEPFRYVVGMGSNTWTWYIHHKGGQASATSQGEFTTPLEALENLLLFVQTAGFPVPPKPAKGRTLLEHLDEA